MTDAVKTYLPIYQTKRTAPTDNVFRIIVEVKDGKRVALLAWASSGVTELGEEMWSRLAPHQVPWTLVEQWADQMIPHLLAAQPAPDANGAVTNRVAEAV